MSSRVSAAESSVGPLVPVNESVESRVATVAKIARDENDHHSVTIVISKLPKRNLRDECKYRGWSTKFRELPPVHITTVEDLQETIDSLRLSPKRTILNLIASSEVSEISFHVPSHFERLKVLRCASKRDKGRLLIDGSSTYHNVRLDKWEAHRHKNHTLILGFQRGVRIKLAGITPNTPWARIVRAREDFTSSEQDDLLSQFEKLAHNSEWEEIKGTVAAIMTLVVGTYKSVTGMKTELGGIDVKYAFGLSAAELGMAGAKITSVATAAGPAIVLGVVAAAAVYFIPWDVVFDYLKTGLSWLWDKICKLWERFKCWVQNLFTEASTEHSQDYMHRPMAFMP
ncbi:hypothetical protein K449DRAFT_422176 [Hypoxylon sp. EC38]|nr:hypothetical protein K449DRAFT_422176 [Hypoxylon sp. EC38]